MSYTYLQEQGAESSAESFADIPQYVLSRLNLIAEKSCSSASATESCQSSQSGMMSELSTESRGADSLILYAPDFHAKTSVWPETVLELMEKEAAYIRNPYESLGKYDPDLRCWKTPQRSLIEGLDEFSETWPHWGIMLDGACWGLSTPEQFTADTEFGFWPTPTKMDMKGSSLGCKKYKEEKPSYLRYFLHKMDGGHKKTSYPNPCVSEALMGWPIGATDLRPLETGKFQQWLNSHGTC